MRRSSHSEKQRITISLPTPLIERLRNAVDWTGHRPLVALVADAIEDIVAQMEEVNGGAFPNVLPPEGRAPTRTTRPSPSCHGPQVHISIPRQIVVTNRTG